MAPLHSERITLKSVLTAIIAVAPASDCCTLRQCWNSIHSIPAYSQLFAEAPSDFWMGWSGGRWDGDMLVIEVTGKRQETWFDRAGNSHSDALPVVERYTPVSPYHLKPKGSGVAFGLLSRTEII